MPYSEDYESANNVPIDTIATASQSPETGEVHILVYNEALWMANLMKKLLINQNQLQHYHVNVQDNPTSRLPPSIITNDGNLA